MSNKYLRHSGKGIIVKHSKYNVSGFLKGTLVSAAIAATTACSTTGGMQQPEPALSMEDQVALMEEESRIRREEAVQVARTKGEEVVKARHAELQLVNDRLYLEETHLNIKTKVIQIHEILRSGELTEDDIRDLVLPLHRLLVTTDAGEKIATDMGYDPGIIEAQYGARMQKVGAQICSNAIQGIQSFVFTDVSLDGVETVGVGFDVSAKPYGQGVLLLQYNPVACAEYGGSIYSVQRNGDGSFKTDGNGKPLVIPIKDDPRFDEHFPSGDVVSAENSSPEPQ